MRGEAREHLLKAVQIWPGYAHSLNNLGRHLRLGCQEAKQKGCPPGHEGHARRSP